nr:MATE family efflux transporter [Streptococcus alactolyticus]
MSQLFTTDSVALHASATVLFYVITRIAYIIRSYTRYFHTELSQLFTTDSVALQASATVLFYSFIGGPATAGTLIYTATWQGLGNARLPFCATTIGMWLIRIVLGYVLGITFNLGLQGVWLATLADNIFRWFLLKFLYHRHLKTLEPAPAT